jgi:hypothetical protein
MTVGSEQSRVRDGRGRFVPGQSGNPAGKLPGTRNRATLLKAALDSEDGPAMARIVIDKALAGDVVTARFCLDRLEPRPRGRAIAIDLPEGGAGARCGGGVRCDAPRDGGRRDHARRGGAGDAGARRAAKGHRGGAAGTGGEAQK